MQFTAQQIATLLQGKLEGDPDAKVSDVAKIEEAKAGSLCFISNQKYEEYLYSTQASIIIVNDTLELSQPISPTLIRVKDAYSSFAALLEQYNAIISGAGKTGIEQPSYVAPTATIGKDVYIGAFAYVGEHAKIGNGVKIYPGSYIGNNVIIGDNSKIYAGVKIYERRGVILHSKTALIDGVWATVGSTNLDWRSLLYNQELNAVILGSEFGDQVQTMFSKDLLASDEVKLAQWTHRGLPRRLKELFARAWAYGL